LGSPFLGTSIAVPFAFNSNVSSAVTKSTTITPSAEFSINTLGGMQYAGQLIISSAMTSTLVARVYTTDLTRYLVVKQETRTLRVPVKKHLREAA
jgi:hypothetical protein